LGLEWKDILSALAIVTAAVIAIVGWSKAAAKDRNQHLFQRRLEKRLTMLNDVIEATVPMISHANPFEEDPDLFAKLSKANLSIQLYGYRNEIRKYCEMNDALKSKDIPLLRSTIQVLVPTIRAKIRSELGYAVDEVDPSGNFDRRLDTQVTPISSL
jgi:hypothetical protein